MPTRRTTLATLIILAIVATASLTNAADSSWDDDEFAGVPVQQKPDQPANPTPKPPAPSPKRTTLQGIIAQVKASKTNWWPELAMLGVLILYMVNYFRGTAANEARAIAFAEAYCVGSDTLFDRNFALLGPGDGDDELLIKESSNRFRLYASGRRHCVSLTAMLNFQPRQDLLLMAWGVLFPSKDVVDIEVVMHDMPDMVLLIGSRKIAKELVKELKDVETLTHAIDIGRDRLAAFPTDTLSVLSEHSSIFYDLMVDDLVQLLFGKGVFAQLQPYFRYMHFTTEHMSDMVPAGTQPRKLLRFSFNLPDSNDSMDDIARLLAAAVLCIDVVGQYKLSPEQQKRATKARHELLKESQKEAQEAHLEKLAKKKQEAKQAELEKARRAGPAALKKYHERQEKLEIKRAMKSRTLKG